MADYSIVIPVYGNEESIPSLLDRLSALTERLDGGLEVVFVVDGSPDRSFSLLAQDLPGRPFTSKLVAHARNFGSFAAIRTGLTRATGRYCGVMAADLQEPPELMLEFFEVLAADRADVVVGERRSRADPGLSALSARVFWGLYRRLVQREMPPGGIDVFACTATFRDHLTAFEETNTSLVALTMWLGFRRETVKYDRLAREHGRSTWTLRKKAKYLSDSIYSFTDLPIRLLLAAGCAGVATSVILATVVGIARLTGAIDVPGYAATILVIAFFSALNLAGLGIVGAYVWRGFENTKARPLAVVMSERRFGPEAS
jgi:glycosyltransferase involved in cell wall biosynthesis